MDNADKNAEYENIFIMCPYFGFCAIPRSST